MNLFKSRKKLCSIILLIVFSLTMIVQPAFASSNDATNSLVLNGHEWIRQDRDEDSCTLIYTDNAYIYELNLDKNTFEFTFGRTPNAVVANTNSAEKESYNIKINCDSSDPSKINSLLLYDDIGNEYLVTENTNNNERIAIAIPAWLGLSSEAIKALIALGTVIIIDGIAHILAEEMIQTLKKNPDLIYFRAVLDEDAKGVFLGENITRKDALIYIQLNSKVTGVFCNGQKYARSLTDSLGGEANHGACTHGLGQGYWSHYHCQKAPNSHIWYV